MINFRFHLVSLIAVFLALGLGILVGSSVVDQVIVDRLEREISSVRSESNDLEAENDQLRDHIAELEESLEAAAPYAVQDRLESVPIALVAEQGVDAGALEAMITTLREAGAEVPGVVWLDESWRLDDEDQVAALGEAIGTEGNAATTRTAALEQVAARVANASRSGTDDGASVSAGDVVGSLLEAGFVSVSDGDASDFADFPAGPARALVVTGTDSRLTGSDTLVQFVRALTEAGVPTVVGEVYDTNGGDDGTAGRGDAVAPVRGDSSLSDLVSTVDDAELAQGRVGTVIALEQIVDRVVGHYGYGRGASAPLPSVPT
jgi:hypothetical protein